MDRTFQDTNIARKNASRISDTVSDTLAKIGFDAKDVAHWILSGWRVDWNTRAITQGEIKSCVQEARTDLAEYQYEVRRDVVA